jgi:two-component sensor histidine kinase
VAAATGARIAIAAGFGIQLPFMTYFPAVLVAAVWGDFLGGAAALVGSAVLAYLYFMPANSPTAVSIWSLASYVLTAGLMVVVGGALRRSVAAMAANEARQRTLAEELSHRAKNGFAVVHAIITQTARSSRSVEAFETMLLSRLKAMATAQELVSTDPDESAELNALFSTALAPFDISRFELQSDGAAVMHNRNLTMTLALILHELATNAVKYGALSNPQGKVVVRSEQRDGMMQILWRETGGPPVADTQAVGFGTRLLQAGLGTYGGRAERVLAPDGVVCTLVFPV